MKNQQTIKRGAVWTAPVGLAGLASRILAGAVALLLISGAFSAAWAITGGEPDGNLHPNVGAVIVYDPLLGVVPYFSGTLVHERVFLTAGHGVAPILDGEVLLLGVSFDAEVDLEDTSTWLPVERVECSYRHNPTNSGADSNHIDIAVLVLKDPVESVAPATLPTAGFLDVLKQAGELEAGPGGTEFTVVGYGWGLDWPPPQDIYPISADGKALRNAAQTGYRGLDESWLIASQNLAAGYGGVNKGDSGGPAFCTDPFTGDEILVAITTWGGSPVGNSFYYRIDTVESLNFIQDVIDSLEK